MATVLAASDDRPASGIMVGLCEAAQQANVSLVPRPCGSVSTRNVVWPLGCGCQIRTRVLANCTSGWRQHSDWPLVDPQTVLSADTDIDINVLWRHKEQEMFFLFCFFQFYQEIK